MPPAASPAGRPQVLDRLRRCHRVPVLIVGGGINGAGLYRELALQGVDCLLVERGDFLCGASAASSHMIHGGLRYLQNGEFRLVRESVAERNRLLQNAPHVVRPLPTTLPLFHWTAGLVPAALRFFGIRDLPSDRGALLAKIGLVLYDLYSRGRGRRLPRHRFVGRRNALAHRPALDPDLVCTATYHDAWIQDPERLGIELVLDAEAAHSGALAVNYCEVVGLADGAVRLRDTVEGETFTCRPQVVVNATGAWVDDTHHALERPSTFMGGTKGSHLVLDHPELVATLDGGMLYFENRDGRICILFPYRGKALAGTTDLWVEHPDQAVCEEAEVDYILESIRHALPGLVVGREHIVFRYCGVRPLPRSDADNPGKVSRDHQLRWLESAGTHSFPILALIGGKWTTFRALAEQAADQVLARLEATPRKRSTADVAIGGGVDYPSDTDRQQWLTTRAPAADVDPERLATFLDRYGTRATELAHHLEAGDSPLATLPDYSHGEIAWLTERERVVRLEDLVLRRTPIGLLGELTAERLSELAEVVGELLGWSDERRDDEVTRVRDRWRAQHGITL